MSASIWRQGYASGGSSQGKIVNGVAPQIAVRLAPSPLRRGARDRRPVAATAGALRGLREVGVRLTIDDFGAGASSLASLHELDADVLKLDRAFVRRLGGDNGDRTVVAGVTALAHAVGMSVTLEGIETNAQLAAARAAGCDRGQGHLFARPLAAGDVTHLLRHGLTRAGSPNGRQASPAYQRSPVGA